ncbi:MAG: hypothetical protein HFI69_04210 [Lachnospiraceae bacterium]|nr:hypothetical protein [Lachnospiraceae bacterium]
MANVLYEYDLNFIKDKKVIIYGIFQSSQIFAMRLIQENISFEGFLFAKEKKKLQSLLNKHVYDIKEIMADIDNIAIIVPFILRKEVTDLVQNYPELEKCISYETIKKQIINAENIIVYGSGKRAEILEKNIPDLKISCYFDSDKDREGTLHKGKKICHPSILKELRGTVAVIIASIYYADMYKMLHAYGCPDENIFVDLSDIVIDENSDLRIDRYLFLQLGKELYHKKVTLYGEKNTVNTVKKIFRHIGVTFSNIISRESISEDGTIYDIFYQGSDRPDMILLTDRPNLLQYEILVKMNYAERNILYLGSNSLFYSYRKNLLHMGLDPILGYGKFSEYRASLLFIKHLWSNEACQSVKEERPVRIVTLGGSTTDENGIKDKSWPEYLCDYLCEHNIPFELYNGGLEAFNVSQELLKLIRDVTELKPDICISYSGVNNIFSSQICEEHSQFINERQKVVFDSLNSHVDLFGKRAECIEWGMVSSKKRSDFWLSQIKMQKAICEALSIKYISILQPNFFTKSNFMEKDQELLTWFSMYIENNNPEFFDDIYEKMWIENEVFQNGISNKLKDIDYVYDMRSIFDDIDNAYIDLMHVRSFANKIIAKEIYELLIRGYYLERKEE